MEHPQIITKVSTSVLDFNINDNKLKKHYLEAEKRLKKLEQDYLHTSQKYTETRAKWLTIPKGKHCGCSRCHAAKYYIYYCNNLVELLQKLIDKLPTTQERNETIDQSMHLLTLRDHKSLAQENMIVEQKTLDQELDYDIKNDFKTINREFKTIQREVPRSYHEKLIHDILREVKENKKCIDSAFFNCLQISNSANHESLKKSVEQEINILKKLSKELQKEFTKKFHLNQYKTSIYKDFKKKMKHLQEKKEYLCGQCEEERKHMSKMMINKITKN